MARYWFRQKQFGYGATPNTWQGWLCTFGGVLAIVAVAFGAHFLRDHAERLALIAVGIPLVMIPFALIIHAKTEGGWHWRWGRKS
ncbi:MAG TPA: hypothetical protein VN685_09035 [Rhizomicrobium sp.]|nr:hypothetical protein [Rhizomicrobium sp.]